MADDSAKLIRELSRLNSFSNSFNEGQNDEHSQSQQCNVNFNRRIPAMYTLTCKALDECDLSSLCKQGISGL